ncbi:MAG: penicillin-binding protein activator [Alphaproteobacteria bacterium]|nr:penicillin-binding protein activator [Alphaproteobacteria bacterium]
MNTAYWRYASFALLGIALVACEHSEPDQPSPPNLPAKAPVESAPSGSLVPSTPVSPSAFRAALLAPATGRHAELGTALLNAAQLALYDAAGKNFVLMPMDTSGTPAGVMEAARQSIERGASMLLGPVFGSNVRIVAEATRARALPVFAFSNDRAALGPGVWLFGPQPEDEVERLIGHAAAEGHKRLGLLAYDTALGRYAIRTAERVARAHDATITRSGFLSLGLDARALSEQVRTFAGAPARPTPETDERPRRFDAVLIATEGAALRSTAALLAFHGINPKRTRYLIAGVHPDHLPLDEPSLVGAWYASPPPETFKLFSRRYQAAYGTAPPRLAGLAYDATAIAAMLAEARPAGGLDIATLTAPDGFFGAGGFFRFHPDGAVQRALAIFELTPEGPRIADPAPQRFDPEGKPVG